MEQIEKVFKDDGTYTVKFFDLCRIIGIKVPDSMTENRIINRVLSQAEYVGKDDVIICTNYYDVRRSIGLAIERGAYAVLCPKSYAQEYYNSGKISESIVIGVDNPLELIQKFEIWRKKECRAKVIAITGSVGKTTTTGLINTIFSETKVTLTHHSMSNSHGAVLRNVQKLSPSHEFWIQEVGGVQPGYIESSAKILQPDAVVLTNISESHLDKYITQENIFYDKASLERYSKPDAPVFINLDDPKLSSSLNMLTHHVISFAINNKDADYRAKDIMITKDGTSFTMVCSEGEFDVKLGLFGEYNAYNALAAIAVASYFNIPVLQSIELVAKYRPDTFRQNMVNIGGYQMLVDCFNAEPKTVLGTAQTLSKIPIDGSGKRIFISGHIDKLGEKSAEMHMHLGEELAKVKNIDTMVFFAGDSKYTYDVVQRKGKCKVFYTDNRDELENWLKNNITTKDITAYKSGQFLAALAKTIDHVYGTTFQNGGQYNEGSITTENGIIFRVRTETSEVAQYKGNDVNVVLPQSISGKNLVYIARSAFSRARNICFVEIPDTVTNIGSLAFYICPKLTEVKFSQNLKIIGDNAFNYTSLQDVFLPNGLIHIGRHAFYECKSLKKVEIPETVGFIGKDAFKLSEQVVIQCRKGSYAEKYALDNHLNYELI